MLKRAWCLSFAMLFFSGCAIKPDDGGAQSQSKVTATLTMDEKTEKLNHVYARRIVLDRFVVGTDEALAVFLSNKPLPLDELGVLLIEFSFGSNDEEFLKDASITGLLFTIKKREPSEPGKVTHDIYIMKAGRLLRDETMGGVFEDFSLARGRIRAYADHDPHDEFFGDEEQKRRLKFSYTASFETEVQGRSACTEFEGAAPIDMTPVFSEPGTARGELVVNGEQIKLEYAYARRKRVFFDEPDEGIEIVVTDRAYGNEELASLLDASMRRLKGVVLEFYNNPGVDAGMMVYKSAESGGHLPGSIKQSDFLIKADRITGTARGKDDFFKDNGLTRSASMSHSKDKQARIANEGKGIFMRIGRFQIHFVALHLIFAGCTTGAVHAASAASQVQSDGQVSGSLIVNGESYPLKHIYTGRWNRQFQLLITNEPVSYEPLSRIFLELNVSGTNRSESKTLKGSTLKALYFTQSESPFLNGSVNQTGGVSFDGILMTSASFFQHGSVRFEAPNFKDGVLRAKATYELSQSFPGEDYQNIKMDAKYSFSFEARIRSESLLTRSVSIENKAFQEGLASLPEPGKAQGTLTASSRVIMLNHSYAMQQKAEDLNKIVRDLLREKPGEVLTVLLTDKPIQKEYLRFSFDRSVSTDVHGLYLYVDKAGQIRWSVIRYPSGYIGFADEAAIKGFKLESGRVSGSVENRKDTVRVQNKPDGYAVTFEAPIKK